MTKYAQQIFDIINASSDHLTAEQIYLRFPWKATLTVMIKS